ncbi:MAG: L-threonine 3-dehydrogenase [Armatimonadetes bacterium]|nr:L-threonine 3-dehydrogenase [Armatimonadota bacterium]
MKAVAKASPAPGFDIVEVDEPQVTPGCVKLRVERASVCGTDLHIYNWDPWSAGRIKPPRIIGHEFCGRIVEIGDGVSDRKIGDFVATESHIVDGTCPFCLRGEGHLCQNTSILGVDVDGGFAPYAVIPAMNARPTSEVVPQTVASMQDAIGNAVHTVMDGPVEGQAILITGMGPIGLFAAAVCKALGARHVYATEVSEYRIGLANAIGADTVINPAKEDAYAVIEGLEPDGVDGTLEMSGHPGSLDLAIEMTRPGGRISLLGLFADRIRFMDLNKVIFKGLRMHGIVGRRLWETWDQMHWLFTEKGLDLESVVTHEMHFTEIESAMQILKAGEAGKIVLSFE